MKKRNSLFMRVSAIIMTILMLSVTVACGEQTASNDNSGKNSDSANSESNSTSQEESTTEEVDAFAGVDFGGKPFRVYTSVNTNDATNANALIEGEGELNGEIVNDAVYTRNQFVEEKYGVKLEFTQSDLDYGAVTASLRQLVLSGDDAYDLIINDLLAIAPLSTEGLFVNINDSPNFDFDKNYWYKGYMEDLKIVDSKMYALAGDYFMDIIGSAHAMYYNKDIINNQYGDKDLMYKHVLDGTWTLDTMTKYVSELYQDLNGNGKNDADDQYGYSSVGMWGPVIPFVIGSDINFVERSDSGLSFGFNNERSISLLEKLNALFYSQGTTTAISDVASMLKAFSNGNTVFTGYLRLSDLANLRDIDFEVGILPYPKLDENQENYVTSSHDTTEIGAIPITAAANVDFISTITEILCRETSKQIIPVYYETALKVKYTRDDLSAQMIDIIHDNFGSTFPLAYASLCGNIFISESFCTPLQSKNTDFASNFAKREKSAVKNLNKLYEQVAALD